MTILVVDKPSFYDLIDWAGNLFQFAARHPSRMISLGFELYVIWLLVLFIVPSLAVSINEAGRSWVKLKFAWFFGLEIPLRWLTGAPLFSNLERSLKAWVRKKQAGWYKDFCTYPAYKEMNVFIEIDVEFVDPKGTREFKTIVDFFAQEKTCAWVWGEGGVGKTATALTICERLIKRPRTITGRILTLPLLLESPAEYDLVDKEKLLKLISKKVSAFTNNRVSISVELADTLLKKGLITLLIDNLNCDPAELGNVVENVTTVAMRSIITSRSDCESVQNLAVRRINPQLIERNKAVELLSALSLNASIKPKSQNFLDLDSLFEALHGRDASFLLLKMYAVQLDSLRSLGGPDQDAKPSINQLMTDYVVALHHKMRGPVEIDIVLKAARIIAWECLRESYFVSSIRRDRALDTLIAQVPCEKKEATSLLAYLEDKLILLSKIKPVNLNIMFTHDPLAEYLAAQYLVCESIDKNLLNLTIQAILDMPFNDGRTAFARVLRSCCKENKDEFRIDEHTLELVKEASQKTLVLADPPLESWDSDRVEADASKDGDSDKRLRPKAVPFVKWHIAIRNTPANYVRFRDLVSLEGDRGAVVLCDGKSASIENGVEWLRASIIPSCFSATSQNYEISAYASGDASRAVKGINRWLNHNKSRFQAERFFLGVLSNNGWLDFVNIGGFWGTVVSENGLLRTLQRTGTKFGHSQEADFPVQHIRLFTDDLVVLHAPIDPSQRSAGDNMDAIGLASYFRKNPSQYHLPTNPATFDIVFRFSPNPAKP